MLIFQFIIPLAWSRFAQKLSFDISEYEHSAALHVDVYLATERYVAKSSRIAGGENQLVQRIFEVSRIGYEGVFAVGKDGYRFAFLRWQIEFTLDVVNIEPVLFGFCAHAEGVGKAHNRKVAQHVIDSAARNAVKYDRIRAQNFLCVVDGKFAVACVLVRIVFDEGNIDSFWFFERIEVAEYHVGSDGAYVETAVAADDFVTFDFALYLASAIEDY